MLFLNSHDVIVFVYVIDCVNAVCTFHYWHRVGETNAGEQDIRPQDHVHPSGESVRVGRQAGSLAVFVAIILL